MSNAKFLRLGAAGLFLSVLLVCQALPDSFESAAPDGTLEFRISDHRQAIGDFERLDITVERVSVHPASAERSAGWLDYSPDIEAVDLTQVVGDQDVTILKKTLPPGEYDAARLVVSGGEGVLKVNGTRVQVPGFEETARVQFRLRAGEVVALLLDVIVESEEDHPGGGYQMHLLEAAVRDP